MSDARDRAGRRDASARATAETNWVLPNARSHPPSPRELIAHIQRTAGNRAVASMLGQRRSDDQPTPGTTAGSYAGPSRPGVMLIQRAPAFGLAAPQATNAFAKTAVRWWRKYPGTTLANFAVIMVEEASRSLEQIGVPAVELDDAPSTSAAVFHSTTWTIGVRVEATDHAANTKIGDLKPEELADFANTFFHEARHAEQRFLMARLAVGKSPGKGAKAIAAEVGVKESVAAAAIKAGGGLSGAEKAKAEQLTEFVDKHIGYKMWITRVQNLGSGLLALLPSPSPSGVDSITTAWTAFAPKIDALRKEAPWADTRIESLSKQASRSAVDEQVLRDVRTMRKMFETVSEKAGALATVVAEWPKMKARQTITVDVAKSVQATFNVRWLQFEGAARDVYLTAEAAYERYPEEADSRTVGDAVAGATLREARSAGTPAKVRTP